jgi:hypothetical protein
LSKLKLSLETIGLFTTPNSCKKMHSTSAQLTKLDELTADSRAIKII